MAQWIRVAVLAAALTWGGAAAAANDDGLREAARIIGEAQKIPGEDGIETTEQVELGGIRRRSTCAGAIATILSCWCCTAAPACR